MAMIPPSSGSKGVFCSEWVNWMPNYELQLKNALMKEVNSGNDEEETTDKILNGLKIVLNSGNGSGGFFEGLLSDLGADLAASINTKSDGDFPAGIPNPESKVMIEATIDACQKSHADLGILLDTDADRCGVVLKSRNGYEALVGNRKYSRFSPFCYGYTVPCLNIGL
jgi:phosphomannomutase